MALPGGTVSESYGNFWNHGGQLGETITLTITNDISLTPVTSPTLTNPATSIGARYLIDGGAVSRNVDLPAVATGPDDEIGNIVAIGAEICILNTGTANLVIRDNGGTPVVTLSQGSSIFIVSNQTASWDSVIGGNASGQVYHDSTLSGTGQLSSPLSLELDVYENGVSQGNAKSLNFIGFKSVSFTGSRADIESIDVNLGNMVIVQTDPNPGEYSTIYAAVNSIPTVGPTAPADNNRWVVFVYGGSYVETQTIVIPSWVYIVGVDMGGCKVTGGSQHLFVLSNNTGVAFLTIYDVAATFNALRMNDCGDFTLCHKLDIYNSPTAIYTSALTADAQVYLEYCSVNDNTQYTVFSETAGGFQNQLSIENYFTSGHSDIAVHITGDTYLLAQSCVFQGDGTGIAIQIDDDTRCDARGVYVQNWATGVSVPAGAGAPELLMTGFLYDGCTMNIDVQNVNCSGHSDGYTEYTKTYIAPTAPFFITNQNRQIVTVAQKGGNFTSVKAASDYITGASSTNVYVIYVGPGVYIEDPIVMQQYVSIMGFYRTSTTIQGSALAAGTNFITGAPNTTFRCITITTSTTAGSNAIYYAGGAGSFRISEVNFINADIHVYLNAAATLSILLDDNIVMSPAVFRKHMYATDTGAFNTMIYYENPVWSPSIIPATTTHFMHLYSTAAGPTARMGISFLNFFVNRTFSPSGIGLMLEGLIRISMQSCIFGGFATAFSIPNTTATAPQINIISDTFINNTADISIANPATIGTINVTSARSKITIDPSCVIGVTINDIDGSIALGGELYQGRDYATITNITTQVQESSTVGAYYHVTVTNPSSLDLTVEAGDGYVMDGTNLKYVTWVQQTTTIPADGLAWLYIDKNGNLLNSANYPDPIANIIISSANAQGGVILYRQDTEKRADNCASQIDEAFRQGIGPFFGSGALVSAGTGGGMKLQVSSGNYWYSRVNYQPDAQDNISMLAFVGGLYTSTITDVPTNYDNGGVITPISAGFWVKHSLYLVGEQPEQSYLFVYAQTEYAAQAAAETAPLPLPPATFSGNVVAICGIIVTDSDVGPLGAGRFIDIRPILGVGSNAVSSTADHNSLLNLTVGNAHPQYFRVDGTSAMQANIDCGGFSITNVNLVDGVDVPAHASRHLPNGADPITTAAPVTIATANSLGVANAFARSDHVHAHGAQTDQTLHAAATGSTAGFMSAADKTKLDAATSANTPSTLMMRSAGGVAQLTSLELESGGTAMALVPSAAGACTVTIPATTDTLVNRTSAQTLTNKTATSATNTLYAKALLYDGNGGSAGAVESYTNVAAPTTGQVLTATSGSAANWQNVAASTITGVLPVANGGTGNSSLTSNGVLVGNGTSPVTTSKAAPSGAFVGTTDTQTMSNKSLVDVSTFIVDDADATKRAAFECSSITTGTTRTLTIPNASTTLVGTDVAQTLTNKTMTSNTNNITASSVFSAAGANTIDVAASATPTSGQALVATGGTAATWQNVSASSLTGVLPVANGGTGVATLASGNVLVGNGTSAVTTNKAAPSGAFVGDTDTQTLTNKTLTDATNNVTATSIFSATTTVDVSAATAPTSGQALVATGGTAATWQNVSASSLTGVLPVANGGTGVATLTTNGVLVGNGTLAVDTTKNAPFGAFVGDTDFQTLSNKSLIDTTTFVIDNLDPTKRAKFECSGISTGSTRTYAFPDVNTEIVGTDGTQTLTDKSLIDATTFIIDSLDNTKRAQFECDSITTGTVRTLTIPDANTTIAGTDATQTLTNKTMTSTTNNVAAKSIFSATTTIDVSAATAPTTGQALIATGPSAATWQNISAGTITGVISVANGGTGNSSLTSNGVLVGNGVSPVSTTKAAPSGTFVGDTDTQTLSNKSLVDNSTFVIDNIDTTKRAQFECSGITTGTTRTLALPNADTTIVGTDATQTLTNKTMTSATNNVAAKSVFSATTTIDVSAATAPTSGQVLTATSSTDANWQNVSASSLTGVLPVANGGTGVATLTSGNVLVGNGTSAVTTTKAAPSGAFVGTTDTQTMTNKSLVDVNTFVIDDVDASKRMQFECSGITTGTTRTLTVPNVSTTIVGTDAPQTLTNKTMTSATNNITASGLFSGTGTNTISISTATNPTTNQVLMATGPTAATWQSISLNAGGNVSGVLPVANGGTGVATLTSNGVLVGAGVGNVSTTKAAPSGAFVGTTDTQTMTNKSLVDSSTSIIDNVDNTKIAQFDCAGITTGTTRTFTFPDANTIIVGTDATQTLTGKTMTSNTNNVTATGLFTGSGTGTVSVSAAAAPSSGQVLTATGATTATWQTPAGGTSGDSIVIYESQPSGTGGNGGATFTNGAWRTRFLNTTNAGPSYSAFVTVAANRMTFNSAGTYYFYITAPAFNIARHQTRLQNITTATTALIGTSCLANAGTIQTISTITGYVTVTSGHVYEVQHQCSTTRASGFGNPAAFGINETYTQVNITKLS